MNWANRRRGPNRGAVAMKYLEEPALGFKTPAKASPAKARHYSVRQVANPYRSTQ
jgi:hypothetical protein